MEEQLDPVTRRWALSHFPRRQQRLVKKQIQVIPRPLPFTQLAPCEFWRFPSLKMGLSGHRFISVGEIQLKSTAGLTSIPQKAPKGACRSGRTVGGACACVQSCWLTFFTMRIFFTTNYAWVPERTVAFLSLSLSLPLSWPDSPNGPGPLLWCSPITLRHHTVGLLWTSDRLVAETSYL